MKFNHTYFFLSSRNLLKCVCRKWNRLFPESKKSPVSPPSLSQSSTATLYNGPNRSPLWRRGFFSFPSRHRSIFPLPTRRRIIFRPFSCTKLKRRHENQIIDESSKLTEARPSLSLSWFKSSGLSCKKKKKKGQSQKPILQKVRETVSYQRYSTNHNHTEQSSNESRQNL